MRRLMFRHPIFAKAVELLPPVRLLLMAIALFWCAAAAAQDSQFLPELDTYVQLDPDMRVWLQMKGTREGGVPQQAEIGPSFDFFIKSLPQLIPNSIVDLDQSESRLLILSMGYRYLPQASGAPGTNRMEPVATFQLPLKEGIVVWDRNRGDLDWQNGDYTWRYRNRLQVERGFAIASHRVTPYASAEVFYQSKYRKWSETDLYAGFRLPLGKVVVLNTYYEHENNTGKGPNQQVNAAGLALNLFFSVH